MERLLGAEREILGPLAEGEQAELAAMLRTLLLTFESDDPLGG
jgi:hypothetical protein